MEERLEGRELELAVTEYKRDIDRTMLRESLKLTPEDRVRRLMSFLRFVEEARRAGRALRGH